MAGSDPKADLHRYLQDAREALLWKLDGLPEYDIRRPLLPTETSRHAGHADILRELIDGSAGLTGEHPNLPPSDKASWQAHYDRVERAAREATSDSNG